MREVTLKSHCQPGLLAAEDCVQPLWWPQPQSVNLENEAQSEEKVYLAAAAHTSWPQAIETPARLPGGLISFFLFFFFLIIAQLCPMGGPFLHTARPSFLGGFCTCHAAQLGAV